MQVIHAQSSHSEKEEVVESSFSGLDEVDVDHDYKPEKRAKSSPPGQPKTRRSPPTGKPKAKVQKQKAPTKQKKTKQAQNLIEANQIGDEQTATEQRMEALSKHLEDP